MTAVSPLTCLCGGPSIEVGERDAFEFAIVALPDPQAVPRVCNYFAQIGIVPDRFLAKRFGELMSIEISVAGMTEHQAGVVAEKLQSSILVDRVDLTRDRHILRPLSELEPCPIQTTAINCTSPFLTPAPEAR